MNNLLMQQSDLYDLAMSRLNELYDRLNKENAVSMGYPVSKEFQYSKLAPFLRLPLNNIGDPYQTGTYKVHTREIETEVVDFFANLYRAKKDDYWGYVTNGGTEGNLYGVYLARKLYPKGVVYFSRAAHYSIKKNIDILGMEFKEIQTLACDTIDLNDLKEKVDPQRPAIIVANIGSTMKEAKDDVIAIRRTLEQSGVTDIYIHSDAALCGAIAPFLPERPHFDFADGCDSIAVSGHKFIGCPMPCGVVVCRKDLIDQTAQYVTYIDGYDHTITGSRNGLTPLFLWYQLICLGKAGLKERVDRCLKNAAFAQHQLNEVGIPVERHPNSITIVFNKPSPHLIDKWQLACHENIAHFICMPNVGRAQILDFIKDLQDDLAGADQIQSSTNVWY